MPSQKRPAAAADDENAIALKRPGRSKLKRPAASLDSKGCIMFEHLVGISASSSKEEAKKAFMTKALQVHPDKGGSSEDFQELQQAYENWVQRHRSVPERRSAGAATSKDSKGLSKRGKKYIATGSWSSFYCETGTTADLDEALNCYMAIVAMRSCAQGRRVKNRGGPLLLQREVEDALGMVPNMKISFFSGWTVLLKNNEKRKFVATPKTQNLKLALEFHKKYEALLNRDDSRSKNTALLELKRSCQKAAHVDKARQKNRKPKKLHEQPAFCYQPEDLDDLQISVQNKTTLDERFYFQENSLKDFKTCVENEGVGVIRSALSKGEVDRAREGIWNWLTKEWGAVPEDPKTWTHSTAAGGRRFPCGNVTTGKAAGQCPGSWVVRGATGVQKVFSKLYDTKDLITSMDALILWRPWQKKPDEIPEDWKVKGLKLHTDAKKLVPGWNLPTVQGLVLLTEANENTGGFICCPRSHRGIKSDPVLVRGRPGDIICFDSRTSHGSTVASHNQEVVQSHELLRMVVPVCMAPRAWASKKVLAWRKKAFKNGATTKHSPHLQQCHSEKAGSAYKPPKLTNSMKRVL